MITTASSPGSDQTTGALGIVQGHAFTVVGAYHLSSGDKIVKLRNTWGWDSHIDMTNAYADKPDPSWTEEEKSEMGFSTNKHDGLIFLTLDEYYPNFSETIISENTETMHTSTYLKKGDTYESRVPGWLTGKSADYNSYVMKVKSDVAQTVWISGNTFDKRSYSEACVNDVKSYNLIYAETQKL